jgi:hypothetical protein
MRRGDETKFLNKLRKILKIFYILDSQAGSVTNHTLKRGDFVIVTLYMISVKDRTRR